MKNAINWFEIPVQDLARAVTFYEAMLGKPLKQENFGGTPIAVFPSDERGVGGALVADPRRKPTADGSLVYLDVTGQLDATLDRAARAGGTVVMPRTAIGDPGFIAIIKDKEGNCVGLHSPT